MSDKILQLYETINIAGYTMAEQGYDVSDLIAVITMLEGYTGISGEEYKIDIADTAKFFKKQFAKEAYQYEKKFKTSLIWRKGI